LSSLENIIYDSLGERRIGRDAALKRVYAYRIRMERNVGICVTAAWQGAAR